MTANNNLAKSLMIIYNGYLPLHVHTFPAGKEKICRRTAFACRIPVVAGKVCCISGGVVTMSPSLPRRERNGNARLFTYTSQDRYQVTAPVAMTIFI